MCLIEYFMTWKIPRKKKTLQCVFFLFCQFPTLSDYGLGRQAGMFISIGTFHGRKFSIFFFLSLTTELCVYIIWDGTTSEYFIHQGKHKK